MSTTTTTGEPAAREPRLTPGAPSQCGLYGCRLVSGEVGQVKTYWPDAEFYPMDSDESRIIDRGEIAAFERIPGERYRPMDD